MRKFILIVSLLLISQQICSAILIEQEMSDPQYLINNGYSIEMAEMVNFQKSRSMTTEFTSVKPVQRCKRNKFTLFWRRCLEYIDPALDDDSFYNHDIKTEPQVEDF